LITDADIKRINELYHKQKAEGLTDSEKEEQAKLRKSFVESVKANMKAQLDNIDLVEKDGSTTNLGEAHAKKFGK